MIFPKSLAPMVSALSALTLTLILSACGPSTPSSTAGSSKGPVAATVNGTAISASRVDLLIKENIAQGQPDSPELRKGIIENLAMQFLLAQEASKKGLDKTPEVADQLELAQQSMLARAFVQDYLKSNPVSEDMLKAEYEKIKGQLTGTEYKARHILVEKEAEAKDIIAKLNKNPKAFAALAKEKSKDPGSKGNGGDLGWFDPRGMVPEFGTAVAALTKGQFTAAPVRSQYGYHIIWLDDSRQKAIPPLDQIKPALQQQVEQQNMKNMFEDIKAKAKIEITAVAAPATPPATPESQSAAPRQ